MEVKLCIKCLLSLSKKLSGNWLNDNYLKKTSWVSVGNSALQAFVCQKGSWKLLETLENFVKQREQRVKSRRPQIIQFYQHHYCWKPWTHSHHYLYKKSTENKFNAKFFSSYISKCYKLPWSLSTVSLNFFLKKKLNIYPNKDSNFQCKLLFPFDYLLSGLWL